MGIKKRNKGLHEGVRMGKELISVLDNFKGKKILVIGDIMLDKSIWGDVTRISPEAPVQVVNVDKETYAPGGAANTANNISALGGDVSVVGVVGNDSAREKLLEELRKKKINTEGIVVSEERPTIQKIRVMGKGQQLLRVDYEDDSEISKDVRGKIFDKIKKIIDSVDAIIISDYAKGIVTKALFYDIMRIAANKIIVVDPKTKYAIHYKGVTLVTPNNYEAGVMANIEIKNKEDLVKAGKKLLESLQSNILITRGEKGMSLFEKDGNITEIETKAKEVYDVTGAGDMVLATLAISLAAGFDYKTSVQLSNVTAGIAVEQFGTVTVTIEQVADEIVRQGKSGKVRSIDLLLDELTWHRRSNNIIVFTNGCFDVLHRGHIEYLEFCKAQGDIVVVGLNSDSSVKAIKGPDRPINNQYDRAAVLAALETVDYITLFDEPDPLNLIKKLKPNVLVKGQDWAEKGVIGREFVESYGGKVTLAPLVEGKSSTTIIEKMKPLEINPESGKPVEL